MEMQRRWAVAILMPSLLLILGSGNVGMWSSANPLQPNELNNENMPSSAAAVVKNVAPVGQDVRMLVKKEDGPALLNVRTRSNSQPVSSVRKVFKIRSLEPETGKSRYKVYIATPEQETDLPDAGPSLHEAGNYIGERPNFAAFRQQGTDHRWCDNPYRCEGGQLCPAKWCPPGVVCCRMMVGTCCQYGRIRNEEAEAKPSSSKWIKDSLLPKIQVFSLPEELGYKRGTDYYTVTSPFGPPLFREANEDNAIIPSGYNGRSDYHVSGTSTGGLDGVIGTLTHPSIGEVDYVDGAHLSPPTAGPVYNANPFVGPSAGTSYPTPFMYQSGYNSRSVSQPSLAHLDARPHLSPHSTNEYNVGSVRAYLSPYIEGSVTYNAYSHNENEDLASSTNYGISDGQGYENPFDITRPSYNKDRDAYAVGENSLAIPTYSVHRAPIDHYNFNHHLFGDVKDYLEDGAEDVDDATAVHVPNPSPVPIVYRALQPFARRSPEPVYPIPAPMANRVQIFNQPEMPVQVSRIRPSQPYLQPHVSMLTWDHQTPRAYRH